MKINLKSLLSRKTSSNYFLPEVDGFRFFAIATVLLYHLNTHIKRVSPADEGVGYLESWLNNVLNRGSVGVDVFFAISGFILALPFARQWLFDTPPVSMRSYYLRRLTRLEPPYVISLIVLLLVHVFILHEQWGNILPNFFASFFYLHSIIYNEWSKINPVAWSLEVEVQFYVLAPFLATCFRIKNASWRRGLLIGVIMVSILHYTLNYEMIEALHLRKSIFMHLHQFLIGFLFADFFLTDWKTLLKFRSYLFDVIGVASLAGLMIFNEPFQIAQDILFSICLFLSFLCLFKGRLLQSFFVQPWIVIIGGMCYSIYLLHYALIAFLATYTKALFVSGFGYEINVLIQFLLIIPLVLIISAVYFALIERPCMDKDWPQKLIQWMGVKRSKQP